MASQSITRQTKDDGTSVTKPTTPVLRRKDTILHKQDVGGNTLMLPPIWSQSGRLLETRIDAIPKEVSAILNILQKMNTQMYDLSNLPESLRNVQLLSTLLKPLSQLMDKKSREQDANGETIEVKVWNRITGMEIHLQNLTVLEGLLEENPTLQNLLNNAENVFSVRRAMTADWEGVYRGFHGMLKSIDKAALESDEENIPPQDKTDTKESPDDLEQVKFNLPSFFSFSYPN
jgi:hypothetical protein